MSEDGSRGQEEHGSVMGGHEPRKATEQVGFANTTVTYENHFEEEII